MISDPALVKFINILLVEDNPGDVRLTQLAFQRSKVRNRLYHVENGDKALAFLRHEGEYASAPEPDLILLDLNLPLKSGSEVLEEIKSDPRLRHIPVVVLTSSESEEDIAKAYALYANCFITKPIDIEQFIKVVSSIDEFWFSIVKLPK